MIDVLLENALLSPFHHISRKKHLRFAKNSILFKTKNPVPNINNNEKEKTTKSQWNFSIVTIKYSHD